VPESNTRVFADLKSKTEHIVTLELPRYEKARLTLTRSVNGWARGNIAFGTGLGVGAFSGRLYKLSPEQLNEGLHRSCQHQPASRRLDADVGSAPRSFFAANRLTAGHQPLPTQLNKQPLGLA
jgi:hypothetical protein